MSPRSPQDAPPRPDLTFLRHRGRPARVAASPALADYLSGHDPHHPHHPPAASSSLDLSAPTPAPTPAPTVSSSLDLSPTPSPTPTPVRAAAPRPAQQGAYQPPRARSKTTTILKPNAPTVTLNRLQSGVGALTFEAACSPAVGDLRLGVAYELAGGESSIVQHASGLLVAPPGSRRPLLAGQRSQFERLTLDLAQVRRLRRMAVYAFSESDTALQWGGTLVVTTLGQARIDLALDRPPSPGVAVLLTVFNIDGELVIRAESELILGSVRDACLAYGFDRITWLDGRTPLT